MSLFALAYKNLFRSGPITFFAILGMALTIACAGLVHRLNLLSEKRFSTLSQLSDVLIGPKSNSIDFVLQVFNGEGDPQELIPENLYRTLKAGVNINFEDKSTEAASGVEAIAGWLEVDRIQNFRIVGTEGLFEGNQFKLQIDLGSNMAQSNEVVIGSSVAKQLGLSVGSSWTYLSDTYHVSGVLKPTNQSADFIIFMGLEHAQLLYSKIHQIHGPWGNRVLHAMIANISQPNQKKIKNLINYRTVSEYVDVPATLESLRKITESGQKVSSLIAIFVTLIGGLLVTVLLVTRFETQSSQLALLRALGFSRKSIFKLLFLESLLLFATACFLGALGDFILFPFLKNLISSFFPVAIEDVSVFESWPIWLLAFAAVFLSLLGPFLKMIQTNINNQLQRLN